MLADRRGVLRAAARPMPPALCFFPYLPCVCCLLFSDAFPNKYPPAVLLRYRPRFAAACASTRCGPAACRRSGRATTGAPPSTRRAGSGARAPNSREEAAGAGAGAGAAACGCSCEAAAGFRVLISACRMASGTVRRRLDGCASSARC